jgi:hypothetical protein
MLIRQLGAALILAGLVSLAGCKHCGSCSNCSPAVCGASPVPGCSNCGGPGRPPGIVTPPPPGPVGAPPGTAYYPQGFERKL